MWLIKILKWSTRCSGVYLCSSCVDTCVVLYSIVHLSSSIQNIPHTYNVYLYTVSTHAYRKRDKYVCTYIFLDIRILHTCIHRYIYIYIFLHVKTRVTVHRLMRYTDLYIQKHVYINFYTQKVHRLLHTKNTQISTHKNVIYLHRFPHTKTLYNYTDFYTKSTQVSTHKNTP